MENPLADLLNAVASLNNSDKPAEVAYSRPDLNREDRKGVPEVIYAGSKTPEQVIRIAEAFLNARGRAILSRVGPELQARLAEAYARAEHLAPGDRIVHVDANQPIDEVVIACSDAVDQLLRA